MNSKLNNSNSNNKPIFFKLAMAIFDKTTVVIVTELLNKVFRQAFLHIVNG